MWHSYSTDVSWPMQIWLLKTLILRVIIRSNDGRLMAVTGILWSTWGGSTQRLFKCPRIFPELGKMCCSKLEWQVPHSAIQLREPRAKTSIELITKDMQLCKKINAVTGHGYSFSQESREEGGKCRLYFPPFLTHLILLFYMWILYNLFATGNWSVSFTGCWCI